MRALVAPSVVKVEDGDKLLGFIAVDSLVGGRCCGGLRMLPDVSEDELRILARCMTLKYGLLGMPQGGAKAGVIGDPDAPAESRRLLLGRFGNAIHDFLRSRAYSPGPDMGTTNRDIALMLADNGIPPSPKDFRVQDSGFYTALGVLAAAREAGLRAGIKLRGARAAIHGFGAVGRALARMLDQAGTKIVAIATAYGGLGAPEGFDVQALIEAAKRSGSRLPESFPGHRMPPEKVIESDVEFLFPCARHHAIHEGNVAAVRAPVISPAANAACTPRAEEDLLNKGVLCLPDFVANAGGVLGGTMEFAGIRPARVAELLENWMADVTRSLLTAAAREGREARELAEDFALRRHAGIQREAENPSFVRRIIGWGVRLHRAAIAPEPLVRRLAERYFERLIAEIRF